MNWSRAKTILIILFLCTAVFQASVLYSSNKKISNISPEILESSIKILAENDVYIDSKTIPAKNYTLPYIETENAVSDYQEFAKLILGEDISKTSDAEFVSELGTVSFSGNSFIIDTKVPSYANTKNERQVQITAKEILKELGINTKNATIEPKKSGSSYEFIYKNMPEDVPIINSGLTLTISDSSLKISGNWFNITEKSSSVKLRSITAVLIDIIKEDIQKPTKITDVCLGYIIPESDMFQKSASLVPVWQITFEDGKSLRIDARNPQ